MTRILQIMTEPEARHKFAYQLGMVGIVVGISAAALISFLAVAS